ncbi:fimbrial protein [Pseudomonas sp. O64]|uniref:fimbrial protein n=1 Tax=Pseudomonas TaxID=286 RepID=UPI000BA15D44|nr:MULTISPECIES: fimbrial protein [unclassified Pseudomonas]MCV2226924.1 type 1 fimbrial protein [Pseudomonas sp. AU10]OZO04052.1 fimbrial protein [Pseudomonas sp. IB20]UNM21214.1 type 1 fimbrial protein [Pseudomonas sp. ArH3a]UXZ23964.1 type 1 fimbrial protein [Pseudomonas sp. YeP6b]
MNTFISLAIASSLMLLLSPCAFAQAPAQGEGVVTLGGEVVDSACGLELASVDQAIDMTPEPIGRLLRNARGEVHPFELRLVNCSLSRPDPSRPGASLPDWQHMRVTFDAPTDRAGQSFALFGNSEGVALHIADALGQESVPGVPMALVPLVDGDMTLSYTMWLVGNGSPLTAGPHSAAVRFKLEYF